MANLLDMAVLLSGGGRTLENIGSRIQEGRLNARIKVVVSSRAGVKGLERAADLAVPTHVVSPNEFADKKSFSKAIFDLLRANEVEVVCNAGFLSLLDIPEDYRWRVVNIHPALLPSFGGHGMYGHHVHEAVLKAGCKVSGCTVHYADQTYDTGPIIVQRTCPVFEDDTPKTLAARVFEQECLAYPEALHLIAEGRVKVEGPRARVLAPSGI